MFRADGAIEAAVAAREAGKIRFIGFTGHKSPHILRRMLEMDFDWDTCQMPINVLDAHYRSFQKEILVSTGSLSWIATMPMDQGKFPLH